jgi:hypothetical protein
MQSIRRLPIGRFHPDAASTKSNTVKMCATLNGLSVETAQTNYTFRNLFFKGKLTTFYPIYLMEF